MTLSNPGLKKRIVWNFDQPVDLLQWDNVHTVCAESRCPNRIECSRDLTATFLIGGGVCTRKCSFCHVSHGKPAPLAEVRQKEKAQILSAVEALGARYVVITSVTRDDDPEGLALHFCEITSELKRRGLMVENLIPDFGGDEGLLEMVAKGAPDTIAHNIETTERLTPLVRTRAEYKKSLKVLQFYAMNHPKIVVKSGFLTGLGETLEEIVSLMKDLQAYGVEALTIGQYLQPSPQNAEVSRIYSDEDFVKIGELNRYFGFAGFAAASFVRSSYRAHEMFRAVEQKRRANKTKG